MRTSRPTCSLPAAPPAPTARFTDAGPLSTGTRNDVEDHAHCVLSFAGPTEVHVVTSSIARVPMPRWYVLGTEGAVVKDGVDPQEAAMIAGDIDAAREDRATFPRLRRELVGRSAETVFEPVAGRWRSYYENVAGAIRGTEDLAVTAESVRAVMGVLDAAKQSAASGQTVEIAAR